MSNGFIYVVDAHFIEKIEEIKYPGPKCLRVKPSSSKYQSRVYTVLSLNNKQDLQNQKQVPSWSWLYGSWINNYLCNQCLSPLKSWARTSSWRGVLDTTLYDKVCQWLATGWWFSPGTPVSSTNKTDRHNITEILLKVALNTINQTKIKITLYV